jgi:kynurenine formamidase
MSARPAYADLPDGCAWDLLDHDMGSLALLTPERVAAAARLVRTGRRFALDLSLDVPSPAFFGRQPFNHEVFELLPGVVLDDKLDNFYPQASTQWDAFGHYGHTDRGFFGGRSAADMSSSDRGILAWHEAGIAGRGVLLDVARQIDVDCSNATLITPDQLLATASNQGVELRDGDVLCVRTGWLAWFRGISDDERAALAAGSADYTFEHFRVPGVGPGPALAELLWDHGVAAIAVDNPGVEPFGPLANAADGEMDPNDSVHTRVLAMLGIPLGEFFDFDALADDCAADGVYEFLFTSAPLGIPGGIGSPPNALALK